MIDEEKEDVDSGDDELNDLEKEVALRKEAEVE